MSTIKLRRSNVPGRVPDATTQLSDGEVAINTHDGKMYFRRNESGTLTLREVGLADRVAGVLYVSTDGNDNNNGTTLAESFATLDAAIAASTAGTTIFLKSGNHTVTSGTVLPANVSIVGDNLRTTSIYGSNPDADILHVNNACYITGVTFRGHRNGAAAVSFPPDGSAGTIITSPYVQNCSSITTSGTGMRIDGSLVSGLRSMVSDAFTQINVGGYGVHLLNRGYAQLVSIFTVACDVGVLCESGGQCSLTNSNCSFGNYGLKAVGKSAKLYEGTLSTDAINNENVITVQGLPFTPNYLDILKIEGDPKYYTIDATTEMSSGFSTITVDEPFEQTTSSGVKVEFYSRSLIAASSITFEYVGSGTDLATALPSQGGIPIQENEVIEDDTTNEGRVYYTSTDHKGDFRIGSELLIDAGAGTIEGTTFDRSLFAILTPYILAIES
jgi:hypothetical protein